MGSVGFGQRASDTLAWQLSLLEICYRTKVLQQLRRRRHEERSNAIAALGGTGCSVSALEAVVDDGLNAGLDAGHVISHGVHASLGRVDLDDVLKLSLASLELVLPELALRLAVFDQLVFWVLSFLEHLLHIA